MNILDKFPIDSKVILIGNEPAEGEDPNKLSIFTVSGSNMIKNKEVLVYKDDDGEEFFSFVEPMPHSFELESSLNKLSWDERWNIFCKGWYIIDNETKERKER